MTGLPGDWAETWPRTSQRDVEPKKAVAFLGAVIAGSLVLFQVVAHKIEEDASSLDLNYDCRTHAIGTGWGPDEPINNLRIFKGLDVTMNDGYESDTMHIDASDWPATLTHTVIPVKQLPHASLMLGSNGKIALMCTNNGPQAQAI